MKNFEIKNQNGRSMIEMLGVLAIIGVLSVGGVLFRSAISVLSLLRKEIMRDCFVHVEVLPVYVRDKPKLMAVR